MTSLTKKIKGINKKQFHFSSLEFLFWAAFASKSFDVIFLRSLGFSNTTIGTIMAVSSVVIVLSRPFWGFMSDKVQSVKKVFILCMSLSAVMYFLMPLTSDAVVLGFIYAIIMFFKGSLASLLDGWVIDAIQGEENLNYGQIRLWGSIGYAVMCFVLSKIIPMTSINFIFISFALLALATILLCLKIENGKPPATLSFKNLKVGSLFKNYNYIAFLVFALIISIPNSSAITFLPNLLQDIGIKEEELGVILSLKALMEIPVFISCKQLVRRFKYINIILISSVFFIGEQLLYNFTYSIVLIIIIQVIHGTAYGLFTTGMVYYIYSIAPNELKTTAQTTATTIFQGVGGIIAGYGGGWFIDNFGIRNMYKLGVCMSTAITILFLISIKYRKPGEACE